MASLIGDELYKIGEDMYTQQLLDEMRGKERKGSRRPWSSGSRSCGCSHPTARTGSRSHIYLRKSPNERADDVTRFGRSCGASTSATPPSWACWSPRQRCVPSCSASADGSVRWPWLAAVGGGGLSGLVRLDDGLWNAAAVVHLVAVGASPLTYGLQARNGPIEYVRVKPEIVAEIRVDPVTQAGRWRHGTRLLRLRPDLDIDDIPYDLDLEPGT
jgi:hypothetical protein